MSAPALPGVGGRTVTVRGTPYAVLLPRLTDPRLHLAAVITSLQVLGQVAFDFELSLAQILVSLLTCAVLEVTIAFRRRRVLMWPASALLTGNGVAFVLRVPGTEHGDWWSMRGWWIYAATAAVALLSKHLIRFRGSHVFNPSNFGLVLCFLLLGPELADPLALWWGPMSPWMLLALAIIVVGALSILSRLRLLLMAATFWLTFAVGIGVLAVSGHEMLARWHLGPITGADFWRVLVLSPEVLIFLFFMITDPRTIPSGDRGRVAFAASVAALAVLLIAPQTTEFATKVALLGALTLVCAARPVVEVLRARRAARSQAGRGFSRLAVGGAALAGTAAFAGALVLAGIPARPSAAVASVGDARSITLPSLDVVPPGGVAMALDDATAKRVARDLLVALQVEAEALRTGDRERAAEAATGAWLASVWRRIDGGAGGAVEVTSYDPARIRLELTRGLGQGQPVVLATLVGTATTESVEPGGRVVSRSPARPVERTFHLLVEDGRYVIGRIDGMAAGVAPGPTAGGSLASVRLTDVAGKVGLDFGQDAFRFGVSGEAKAMMGGGLCWIDYDHDGWTDLFVVNSYADDDYDRFASRGGPPRSRLFRNERGRFRDVTGVAGIDLRVKGTGCAAADLDLDGHTDLFVTTATYDVERDAFDALLWNDGDGTFTEGAKAAGITDAGWHAGATVGDVDGDGRPDLFVAGYTEANSPVPGSIEGFPTDHLAVRDRLYLNAGPGPGGRTRFREVGRQAGIEQTSVGHGLGAVFTDVNLDGRLDLLVANDEDPNSLYVNVPWPGGVAADPRGLGFRLEDRAADLGVDDPNAGMGVAAADYDEDGRPDLFVSNSRDQLHALARSDGDDYADARPEVAGALGGRASTGWGTAWVDLDNDTHLDLVLANGAIPVTNLRRDAQRIEVLQNLAGRGQAGLFADASKLVGATATPRVNGRGLAAADFDNDGDVDLAVNSIGGPLMLLRNDGATGRWLTVRLAGLGPGTRVTAVLPDGRRLVREAQAGSSYLSSHDPRLHFGLGRAGRVRELLVRGPDGFETRLEDVAADRVITVRR